MMEILQMERTKEAGRAHRQKKKTLPNYNNNSKTTADRQKKLFPNYNYSKATPYRT